MRLARRTYVGAFHHGMNRGYEGRPILQSTEDKKVFLELLERVQALMQVRVLAYCIMDNHYHIVLENSSGRMSDFFKQLNGCYAMHYRKHHGGRGYVFQDRYKTMLIQDEAYLMVAIAYVLRNPIKAKLVTRLQEYSWSSAGSYFSKAESSCVDTGFVEGLFGNRADLERFVMESDLDELPTIRSELGWVIGGEDFVTLAQERAERRSGRESIERRRHHDKYFEPVQKVYEEFERMHGVRIGEIELHTLSGKRKRADLLVELKERAGMTYREIAKLDLFADLECNSLGQLFKQALQRRQSKSNKVPFQT